MTEPINDMLHSLYRRLEEKAIFDWSILSANMTIQRSGSRPVTDWLVYIRASASSRLMLRKRAVVFTFWSTRSFEDGSFSTELLEQKDDVWQLDGRVPMLFGFPKHGHFRKLYYHHMGPRGQYSTRRTRSTRCGCIARGDFPSPLRILPHWMLLCRYQALFEHSQARIRNGVHRCDQTATSYDSVQSDRLALWTETKVCAI